MDLNIRAYSYNNNLSILFGILGIQCFLLIKQLVWFDIKSKIYIKKMYIEASAGRARKKVKSKSFELNKSTF